MIFFYYCMNRVCVFGMHVLKTDVWNQKPEIHVSVHSYIILYYGEERQGVQSDIWPAGIFYIYLMEQACWEWPLPWATRQRLDTASCTPDSQVILLYFLYRATEQVQQFLHPKQPGYTTSSTGQQNRCNNSCTSHKCSHFLTVFVLTQTIF